MARQFCNVFSQSFRDPHLSTDNCGGGLLFEAEANAQEEQAQVMTPDEILVNHDGYMVKAQLIDDKDGLITYLYAGSVCVISASEAES